MLICEPFVFICEHFVFICEPIVFICELAYYILNENSYNHTLIHAAYTTNRAQMATDLGAFDGIYGVGLTGYVTLGDTDTWTAVAALTAGYAIILDPENYNFDAADTLAFAEVSQLGSPSVSNPVIPGTGRSIPPPHCRTSTKRMP